MKKKVNFTRQKFSQKQQEKPIKDVIKHSEHIHTYPSVNDILHTEMQLLKIFIKEMVKPSVKKTSMTQTLFAAVLYKIFSTNAI